MPPRYKTRVPSARSITGMPGPIYRFCFVWLDNQQAAEDATSEIYLKALGNLGGYPCHVYTGDTL